MYRNPRPALTNDFQAKPLNIRQTILNPRNVFDQHRRLLYQEDHENNPTENEELSPRSSGPYPLYSAAAPSLFDNKLRNPPNPVRAICSGTVKRNANSRGIAQPAHSKVVRGLPTGQYHEHGVPTSSS